MHNNKEVMEISKKNAAQAVGALIAGATLGLLFAPVRASKSRKLLKKRKSHEDTIREKIKEATHAMKKKSASKIASLEQKIEHKIEDKAAALKNAASPQRRPQYRQH